MRVRSILAIAALLVTAAQPTAAQAAAAAGNLAFVRGGDVWLKQGSAQPWRVTKTGTASWPRLASDGLNVAYADHGDISIAYIGGGPDLAYTTRMTHGEQASGPAWSPDGSCWGIFDDCLTVLDLATNTEKTVASWGGGGEDLSGFATTPSWSGDSRKLFWTQQEELPEQSDPGPVRAIGWVVGSTQVYQVGKDGDAQPIHLGHGAFLVTAMHNGTPWIARIGTGGAREWLVEGVQADWRSPA